MTAGLLEKWIRWRQHLSSPSRLTTRFARSDGLIDSGIAELLKNRLHSGVALGNRGVRRFALVENVVREKGGYCRGITVAGVRV